MLHGQTWSSAWEQAAVTTKKKERLGGRFSRMHTEENGADPHFYISKGANPHFQERNPTFICSKSRTPLEEPNPTFLTLRSRTPVSQV